jgi:hypothetical protein
MPISAAFRSLLRVHLGVCIYTFGPMATDTRSGNPQLTMSVLLQDKLRRQLDIAERWGGDGDPDQLLVRCRALLVAADQLEAAASAARSPRISPAVLGCLGEALDSLATVSLLLSQTADRVDHQPEDPDVLDANQLLYAISQNLRFASEAAGLGHRSLQDSGAPAS